MSTSRLQCQIGVDNFRKVVVIADVELNSRKNNGKIEGIIENSARNQ